jgi:hypothetical protein
MTAAQTAVAALVSWLESEAGYSYARNAIRSGLQGPGGGLGGYIAHRFGADEREQVEELVQEFLEFFFRDFTPTLESRPDQLNAVLNGQADKVMKFALSRFFWNLRDKARQKEVNPRAYLHRRTREVLQSDPRFSLHKDVQNNLFVAPSSRTEVAKLDPGPFFGLEYSQWPAPPEPSSRDAVFTAEYISSAALGYLEEADRRLPYISAVPLREFVRYLAHHLPWLNRFQPEELSDTLALDDGSAPSEEHLEHKSSLASIAFLAQLFAEEMDDTARLIFYWLLGDPPLSYKEIASRLGLPDHNHPYRIQRRTVEALQEFTRNWPGPPLHELPEEVGLAFLEELRKICKKSVSRP